MELTNLNNNSNGQQTNKDGSQPNIDMSLNVPAKPETPSSISINFTPKTPVIDLNSKTETLNGSVTPAQTGKLAEILKLDIKKEDLKKADLPAAPIKLAETPKVEHKAMEFFDSKSLQEKAGTSKLMENIASQKGKETVNLGNVLGKSTILEKTIEQEAILKQKKKLRFVQAVTFLVFLLVVGGNLFLYSQLSPSFSLAGLWDIKFDSNLRNELFNENQSLKATQTEYNKYRYLSGQLYLNQFGFETTRFMDAVNNLPGSTDLTEKTELTRILAEAKDNMPKLLQGAKTNLVGSLIVPTFKTRGEEVKTEQEDLFDFQKEVKNAILMDKKALMDGQSRDGVEGFQNQLSIYDNAAKLSNNAKLSEILNKTNIDNFQNQIDQYIQNSDNGQKEAFEKFVSTLLASTKVNLATINNLRNNRINWSKVIERVAMIINDVNTKHNSGLGSGNVSVIELSGIELNGSAEKIVISGVNTTKSGTNREVMTFLIEAMEAAPEFKNVSNRSFPLSKTTDSTGESSFSMNFKIEMEIEDESFSKMNTPIADLANNNKLAVRIPVKKK